MGGWYDGTVMTLDLTHVVLFVFVNFGEVDLFFCFLFFLLEFSLKLQLFLLRFIFFDDLYELWDLMWSLSLFSLDLRSFSSPIFNLLHKFFILFFLLLLLLKFLPHFLYIFFPFHLLH